MSVPTNLHHWLRAVTICRKLRSFFSSSSYNIYFIYTLMPFLMCHPRANRIYCLCPQQFFFYYSSSVWWQKGGKNKKQKPKTEVKKEEKTRKIHVFHVCSHLRGVGLMSPIIYINSDRSRFRLPKSTTLFR